MAGATNTDWEDIACGPGPLEGRSYLYDANADERLDLSDGIFVLGFLFGGTSAIPPPYPDPAPCP
ncbi:MAG: hypothetical protein O7J95_01990 [Planctomycetota bacterium]|nr:hypothetical protein [Planctomycetota bacterium]